MILSGLTIFAVLYTMLKYINKKRRKNPEGISIIVVVCTLILDLFVPQAMRLQQADL